MYNYCIFLRGVNVNGIKIKMAELSDFLNSLGYKQVKTILATGNIVISVDQQIQDLVLFQNELESKLSQHFGYEAFLFIRDFIDINNLVTSSENLKVSSDCHIYALIIGSSSTQEELLDIFATFNHSDYESLYTVNNDMFWVIEKGQTLLSEFGKQALGNKHFKARLTSRNMNTIRKIHKQMLL